MLKTPSTPAQCFRMHTEATLIAIKRGLEYQSSIVRMSSRVAFILAHESSLLMAMILLFQVLAGGF